MSKSVTSTALLEPNDYSFASLAKREEAKIRMRIMLRQLLQQGVVEPTKRIAIIDILSLVFNAGHPKRQMAVDPSEARFRSKITQIEGISDALAVRLFNEFGSIEALAQAPLERFLLVEGISEARTTILVEEVKNKFLRR